MPRAAILVLCAFLLLIMPAAVSAQTRGINTLQISLWPEYDRPEVLVIYQFTLSADTALPAKVSIHIPSTSGGLYNLAYAGTDENGNPALYNLEYESQTNGDWMELTFTAPTALVHLEYYDPGMLRTGESREFTYTWAGDYQVEAMTIKVRPPANAKNIRLEPNLDASGAYESDQYYYTASIGQVMKGSQFSFKLFYDKPDQILADGYDQVYAVEDGSIVVQSTFQSALPWIFGSLGLLLITIAVLWFMIPNQEGLSLRERLRGIKHEKQSESIPMYCHICGARSNEDDQFCRACGTKLRK